MWIYTCTGNLINTDQVKVILTRELHEGPDGLCVAAELVTNTYGDSVAIMAGVSEAAADEIIEKLAWCIVHNVDMVRVIKDGDVLELISYSNHGTARHTQRVYLKQ